MRHKNKVKQLGKTQSHRKAMFNNMVTSFFDSERIVTTKQKGKELKKISEKLITRAKNNLEYSQDVMKKLFDDIAPRFKERNGGYTRMYLLGRRQGDAAEMAIVELVERKEPVKAVKETDKKAKKK